MYGKKNKEKERTEENIASKNEKRGGRFGRLRGLRRSPIPRVGGTQFCLNKSALIQTSVNHLPNSSTSYLN